MNLKNLSDRELHKSSQHAADGERLATQNVLAHLRENERRMLYAKMGYRDLKAYCVRELKLSEGSAWRRISGMKLMRDNPEIANKLETGELNLTQASMAQAFFREAKSNPEEKRDILSAIENQSTRATERILAEKGPDKPKPKTREQAVKGGGVKLTVVLGQDLLKDLEEIEILIGKKLSKLELIAMMTKKTLEALRKQAHRQPRQPAPPRQQPNAKCGAQPALNSPPVEENSQAKSLSKPEAKPKPKRSRHISRRTIREVKKRDVTQCQYRDPVTGKACEGRHNLHIEHRTPFAKGGSNEAQNLELLCPSHNRLRAVQAFGVDKMKEFIPSLQ